MQLNHAIGAIQGYPYYTIARVNGVNKIQGKLTSGNFSVYLTANTLNTLKTTGVSGLAFLLGGGFGFAASTILNLISADRNFKHDRVFVFRGWVHQYWYYQ